MHSSTLLLVFQLKKTWRGFLKVPWKHRRVSCGMAQNKPSPFTQLSHPLQWTSTRHIAIFLGQPHPLERTTLHRVRLTPSALLDPNFYEPSSTVQWGVKAFCCDDKWTLNLPILVERSLSIPECIFYGVVFKGTSPIAGSGDFDQWALKTHLRIGFRTL